MQTKYSRWIITSNAALPHVINLVLAFFIQTRITTEFKEVLLWISILQYFYGFPLVVIYKRREMKSALLGIIIGLVGFNILTILYLTL